ncbi:hypothetical protein [Rhodococcoides kroppenstedtii]|uniref:hypothetical protein n=1 Tax=Rhodococcoides kroppenstedtii TaxID=293050 RepID=UPI0016B16B49|nr:hypothetical protein [Rhodococcus kroppenstedtii]NIL81572.1 hypothetical protein [Rhodococcus kroppenstedtii]
MTDDRRPTHDERAYRDARRAAVREHHPDAGGDADVLMRVLADIDRRFGVGGERPRSARPVDVVVVTSTPRRVLRLVRRAGKALPRRRTYVDITSPPRP